MACSQLPWWSLLSGTWNSSLPITDLMILGSLAASACASLSAATGSLAVTASFPRETNTQPSVPSNLMPLGNSPLTIMWTPLA